LLLINVVRGNNNVVFVRLIEHRHERLLTRTYSLTIKRPLILFICTKSFDRITLIFISYKCNAINNTYVIAPDDNCIICYQRNAPNTMYWILIKINKQLSK